MRRRYRKYVWILSTSAIVIGLLYFEQAGLLFVLSTLALSVLLLIVAFSNLEGRDKELHEARLEKMDTRAAESARRTSLKKEAA